MPKKEKLTYIYYLIILGENLLLKIITHYAKQTEDFSNNVAVSYFCNGNPLLKILNKHNKFNKTMNSDFFVSCLKNKAIFDFNNKIIIDGLLHIAEKNDFNLDIFFKLGIKKTKSIYQTTFCILSQKKSYFHLVVLMIFLGL